MDELRYFPIEIGRTTDTPPKVQWITYNVHSKHQSVLQEYVSNIYRDEEGFIKWCTENDIDLVKVKVTRDYSIMKIEDLCNDTY